MAGKTTQSRSPRDAGEGRAQRCVPSAREFWRRRRVREECRRDPQAGGGRGKFSGEGTDVPATAIGIQPCNRERCPTGRSEQSSPYHHCPAPGQSSAARTRVVDANPSRTLHQREDAALDFGAIRAVDGTRYAPSNNERPPRAWPNGRTAAQTTRAQPEASPRNSGHAVANVEPTRQHRARPSPRDRHAVTPIVWCAVAR